MCKKHTSVSHSSTESEIISLDAGLKLDGIPALDFWDLIVAFLVNTNQNHTEEGDLLMNKREVRSPPHTIPKRNSGERATRRVARSAMVEEMVNACWTANGWTACSRSLGRGN